MNLKVKEKKSEFVFNNDNKLITDKSLQVKFKHPAAQTGFTGNSFTGLNFTVIYANIEASMQACYRSRVHLTCYCANKCLKSSLDVFNGRTETVMFSMISTNQSDHFLEINQWEAVGEHWQRLLNTLLKPSSWYA